MATPTNAARVTRARGSLFLARTPTMLTASRANVEPLVLVACGDMLNEVDHRQFAQPIDIPARSAVAVVVAQTACRRAGTESAADIQARVWAELCATWAVTGKRELNDANGALAQLNIALNASPPGPAIGLAIWQTVYNTAVAAANNGTVPWNEVVANLPPNAEPVDNVQVQKADFCATSAHAFNRRLIVQANNAVDIQVDGLSVDFGNAIGDLPATNWVVQTEEQSAAVWRASDISQKLAYMEFLFQGQKNDYLTLILAAAAGVIFSLIKGNDVTERWVTAHVNRLQEQLPTLRISDKVTRESLASFSKFYVGQNLQTDVVSSFIQSVYPSLVGTEAESLSWIIEQARGRCCTHATAFAQAVTEWAGHPLVYLKDVPRPQRDAFIKLAVLIIVDPWITLGRPPITAREYVDFANFGTEAQRVMNPVFRNYSGGFISGGTCRQAQIKAWVAICNDNAQAAVESASDPMSLIRDLLPRLQIAEVEQKYFIYDNTNREIMLDPQLIRQAVQQMNDNAAGGRADGQQQGRQDQQADGGVLPGGQPAAPEAIQVPEVGFQPEIPVRPDDGEDYVDGVEPAEHLAFYGPRLAPIVRGQLLADRIAWPRNARRLPRNAKELRVDNLMAIISAIVATDPLTLALKDLCDLVTSAVQQHVLTPFGDNQNNVALKNRYKFQTDNRLESCLRALGTNIVECAPGYRNDAADVAYNANTMIQDADLVKPRRDRVVGGVVAVDPLAGAQ